MQCGYNFFSYWQVHVYNIIMWLPLMIYRNIIILCEVHKPLLR